MAKTKVASTAGDSHVNWSCDLISHRIRVRLLAYRSTKSCVKSFLALVCLEKLSAGVATVDGHKRFLRWRSSVGANGTVSENEP